MGDIQWRWFVWLGCWLMGFRYWDICVGFGSVDLFGSIGTFICGYGYDSSVIEIRERDMHFLIFLKILIICRRISNI